MTVTIDNDTALDMLMERVRFWAEDDDVTLNLFEQYYSNMLDEGAFDGCEFNVMDIVDNDYVNWFSVTTRKDAKEDFNFFTEENILAEDQDGNILYFCC